MALTKELLLQQEGLKGLTEEQLTQIATLSLNDETTVVGRKVREIYDTLDANILSGTGIAKQGTEKTSEYLLRASQSLKDSASKADTLRTQLKALEGEKSRLEGIIADGGATKEMEAQLEHAKAELKSTKTEYGNLKDTLERLKADHEKEMFDLKVDNILNGSMEGIRFKDTIPESVQKILVSQAMDKVKSFNPYFNESGTLIFRDKDGLDLKNANNSLNPYTADELIKRELQQMDVLDNGTKTKGGGTEPPKSNGGSKGTSTVTADLSLCKTRVEADIAIGEALKAQGIAKYSDEWFTEHDRLWEENKVGSLPESEGTN